MQRLCAWFAHRWARKELERLRLKFAHHTEYADISREEMIRYWDLVAIEMIDANTDQGQRILGIALKLVNLLEDTNGRIK